MSTIYEHILNEMREMPNVSEIKLKEKHSEVIVTIGTMQNITNFFSGKIKIHRKYHVIL